MWNHLEKFFCTVQVQFITVLSSQAMKGEASGDSFISRSCVCRELSATPHPASVATLVTVWDEFIP